MGGGSCLSFRRRCLMELVETGMMTMIEKVSSACLDEVSGGHDSEGRMPY